MHHVRRAQRLAVAVVLGLAAGGCASAGGPARPSPFPGSPGGRVESVRLESVEASARRSTAVRRALDLRGTPYRFGGDRPETGLDCSGLVRYVFGAAGVELPRTVAEQYDVGVRIDRDELQPGDLIFFDTMRPGPSHVGIAIDATTFVHAPGSGGVVRVDQLAAPYWRSRLRGIRRVTISGEPGTGDDAR